MQRLRIIIFLVSAVTGIFAAAMAYLIAYEEYSHHFPDKSSSRKLALETAFFALALFLGIGVVLAVLLPAFL